MTTLMIDIEEKSPGFLIVEIASFLGFAIIYANTTLSSNKRSKKVATETVFFLFFPLLVFVLGWIELIKWVNPIMITYAAFLASVLLKHSEGVNKTSMERLFNAVLTSTLFALSLVCIKNDGNTQLDDLERSRIFLLEMILFLFFFLVLIRIRFVREKKEHKRELNGGGVMRG